MSNKNLFSLAAIASNPNRVKISDEAEFLTLLARSKNGDLESRNKLLLANLGLIIYIAGQMNYSKIDKDDLVIVASIRFLEIINEYDPAKGSLSTYIWRPLLQAMRQSIPGYNQNHVRFLSLYNNTFELLETKFGRRPSAEEISDFMGVSKNILNKHLITQNTSSTLSLDALISCDNTETTTLGDLQPDSKNTDSSADLFKMEDCKAIRKAWDKLSPSDRNFLSLRLKDDGSRMSLRDAERKFGISKETIRCHENVAKAHFKKILDDFGVMAA
ncbi:MAG: sigma-70 family RNA polymerase sigma factor [Treponema sp.]|nr:sigma-70 family RNA polymerase sigma factor [Treponema sp.]